MSADISLLVVGGGPAGMNAALQARELGAQVTLLEAAQVGGTNLNRGPAPVRTLARAARLARDWSSWSTFGLEGGVHPGRPPANYQQADISAHRQIPSALVPFWSQSAAQSEKTVTRETFPAFLFLRRIRNSFFCCVFVPCRSSGEVVKAMHGPSGYRAALAGWENREHV